MKWILWIAGGLVGLLLMGAVGLMAAGHRAGAGKFQVATEIDAPREQVWKWLEEPDKLKQWISWVVDVRTEGPAGVGAKRSLTMKDENNGGMLMTVDGVYTAYEPPSRLALHITTGNIFDGEQIYQLTDLGNGRTRLELSGHYEFRVWYAKLAEPLVTPQARKKMVDDLAHLKLLAEK